jgi:hypothetical protein
MGYRCLLTTIPEQNGIGGCVDRAVALPLTTVEGNQVRVVVNYELKDESLLGQRVNELMLKYFKYIYLQ